MNRVAYLFPGQGSQFVGMGRALWEASPRAREIYALADEVMGVSLSAISFEGPEETLRETRYTQPAILAHSIAALGEFSALVAAGALGVRDALEAVKVRADLMFRAGVDEPGAMAALLGLAEEEVAQICREIEGEGVVVPANLNGPGQVVVSGEVGAVERAMALAAERGAKRAVRLPVSGAFHSPLMKSANAGLAAVLDRITYRDARVPVVANVSARPLSGAADLRAASKAQLLGAVRWEASMRRLLEDGAAAFVEIGPGKVLRGLLKKIDGKAASANVEGPDDLGSVLALVRGAAVP
jgi:[acyl-carrier-protein] S-malonyltransferase